MGSHYSNDDATSFNLYVIDSGPIKAKQLREATAKEATLSQVLRYTKEGWPSELPENLKTYHRHHTEFSSEGGCLLRGMRVVIPEIYRPKVLQELHISHPGVVRMKRITRSRVWWPSIDQDIESAVASCEGCQGSWANPPAVTLHPLVWPSGPWDRIHIDFAGQFMNSMFLLVVDAYSKWVARGGTNVSNFDK